MVQNINMQNTNAYGSIDKIGKTNNGRVVYQITDSNGNIAGKMSIPEKDCDTFEKSYNSIIESAPKLQAYAQTTTPEDMKKKQKRIGWTIGIGSGIGGFIGIYLSRNMKTWKQILTTLAGTVAGFLTSSYVAGKTMTPPGARELSQATNALSKIDIQPVTE